MALTQSSANDQVSTFYESITQPFSQRAGPCSRLVPGVYNHTKMYTWPVSQSQSTQMVLSPILRGSRFIWTDEASHTELRIKIRLYNSLPFISCHVISLQQTSATIAQQRSYYIDVIINYINSDLVSQICSSDPHLGRPQPTLQRTFNY